MRNVGVAVRAVAELADVLSITPQLSLAAKGILTPAMNTAPWVTTFATPAVYLDCIRFGGTVATLFVGNCHRIDDEAILVANLNVIPPGGKNELSLELQYLPGMGDRSWEILVDCVDEAWAYATAHLQMTNLDDGSKSWAFDGNHFRVGRTYLMEVLDGEEG